MKNMYALLIVLLAAAAVAHAQWVQTSGPEGGLFGALAADGNRITGVTTHGVAYEYNGNDWQELGRVGSTGGVRTLLRFDDTLIAEDRYRLYRSNNSGADWVQLDTEERPITELKAHGRNLYMVARDTIYVSRNMGIDWEPILTELPSVAGIAISKRLMAINVFSTELYLYETTDQGKSWRKFHSVPVLSNEHQLGFISTVAFDGVDMLVGILNKGVFRSTDSGGNWNEMSTGLPTTNDGATVATPIFMKAFGDHIIAYDNQRTIYVYDGSAWRVEEGDRVLAFASGEEAVASTWEDLIRFDEGTAEWDDIHVALRGADVGAMITTDDGLIVATDRLYKTTDDGESWKRSADFSASRMAARGDALFALATSNGLVSLNNKVFRSTDAGETWTPVDLGLPEPVDHIVGLTADDEAVYISYSSIFSFHGTTNWESGGVYRSTDDGESWVNVSNGLPRSPTTEVPTSDIFIDHGVLLAATVEGLFRSLNHGGSWAPASNGLPQTAQGTIGGSFIGAINGDFYLLTFNGIYRSTTDGADWTATQFTLDQSRYEAVMGASIVDDSLFVTRSSVVDASFARLYTVHLYESGSWNNITEEIPTDLITTGFIRKGSSLFAGTLGNSVWRRSLASSSVRNTGAAAGSAFGAIRPNPFADRATIDLNLDTRTSVHLDIVDALGRIAATVVDGREMEAGPQSISLDGTDLPAGTYFLRLVRNDRVEIQPIIKDDF